MPHVIIKLYAGRSDELKQKIADEVAETLARTSECDQNVVSVAIEEYTPDDWPESVYKPDILDKSDTLYVHPGYNPFDSDTKEQEPAKDLMAFVRGEAEKAMAEDTTGYFNPMSWLDLTLEDNPHLFDTFFDRPWETLSDAEKMDRAIKIRSVL